MQIKVHFSICYQNAQNCLYEFEGEASTPEKFREFVAHDHVFIDFKDNKRSIQNFLGADYAVLDCDNDHSDDEAEWLTLKGLTKRLSGVRFVAYTSRSHMKQKGDKSPRPRFHVVFPVGHIDNAETYTALVRRIQGYMPVFDGNALDAARFFFGNREAKAYFNEGDLSIADFLEEQEAFDALINDNTNQVWAEPTLNCQLSTVNCQPESAEPIPQGSRNATLSKIAARLLKRYGDSGEAASEFINAADRCVPLLDGKELDSIWRSAKKFYYTKVTQSPDYIQPEEYNSECGIRNSELIPDNAPIPQGQKRICAAEGDPSTTSLRDVASGTAQDDSNRGFSREPNVSAKPNDSLAYCPPVATGNCQLSNVKWEPPVPFDQPNLPEFPTNALPYTVRGFVEALAESTQTPVDMCACSVLAALALCVQGRYRIQGKPDWVEPLNLYVVSIAEPSERKSAVISAVSAPITDYEAQENNRLRPLIEQSKMKLRVLEAKQKNLEAMAAKGNLKNPQELEDVSCEIADYRILKPLKLYVDDITTEKLSSALSENGKTAIISSEGGIFDLLAGRYSKHVNIDVFLKAYSGDTIRVDRIGRASESILNPAMTVLLTVQPSVVTGIMCNNMFRGRGLTARFLYCIPRSRVGQRRFETKPIPNAARQDYCDIIEDILGEPRDGAELITLDDEAQTLLKEFSEQLEPKLRGEHSDIADWAGKLVGTVLRLSGILRRADNTRFEGIVFDDPEPLIVDGDTMQRAITLGSYFIQHAKAAYDLMGADRTTEDAKYILDAVIRRRLEKFTRRDVMRFCKRFGKATDVQPALNILTDRGYLWEEEKVNADACKTKGCFYHVNPIVYSQ